MVGHSALSRAKDLKDKAKADPSRVTPEEVTELLDLLTGEYQEARTIAAGAFDCLYTRPALFEPVAGELVRFSAHYPRGQAGIPAPVEVFSDDDLREVVLVSDSLARVAQRDPTVLLETTNELVDIVRGDRSYPKYHLFTLGLVGAVAPDRVPMDDVRDRLCELLETPTHGYAGWAADTLRRVGDSSVLPILREKYPDSGDDATIEAFDRAITELEEERGEPL